MQKKDPVCENIRKIDPYIFAKALNRVQYLSGKDIHFIPGKKTSAKIERSVSCKIVQLSNGDFFFVTCLQQPQTLC